ncbi:MAG: hypothetical protein DGJ47_000499 [Rickettsiaceae bacterium]
MKTKKFIPMALMMMFILFNYATVRSIKDGLVVTNIGPEAIGFLKMYFVLPSAMILMIVYAKLCNIMSPQKVFVTVTSAFIGFFVLFTFVLYPNPQLFHAAPETIEELAVAYPYVKWFIRVLGNWSYSLFYIVSEMWGSMMLTLLFWQFANQTTKTSEAKRFYSMFGLIGNVGLLFVGLAMAILLNENLHIVSKEVKLIPLLSLVIINSFIVLYLYKWVNNHVLTDPSLYDPSKIGPKKKKAKLSLVDSFKMIFTSRYLGLIAMLVFSYGVSINLVEGVWKSKVRELYNTTESYTAFMGTFQVYQGIAAIFFMLVGSNILRRVSWFTAAMFTPIMILITGVAFFSFIFFGSSVGLNIAAFFGTGPLALVVAIGTAQNVLSKGVKYSLFDSTKEMSYIPLDDEMKSKGKAAVDVIGGRLGKSGGGFIQSTLFTLMPTFTFVEATPYLSIIFFAIVILWICAVKMLGNEYDAKIAEVSSGK